MAEMSNSGWKNFPAYKRKNIFVQQRYSWQDKNVHFPVLFCKGISLVYDFLNVCLMSVNYLMFLPKLVFVSFEL